MQPQKSRFSWMRWIAIGLIGVGVSLLLAIYPLLSQASPTPIVPSFSEIKQIAPDAKPLGQAIRVGLRIKNIYDLKLSTQSFMADGWYQLSWGNEVQAILDKFQIEPSQIVEFTNEIDPGNSFSQTLVDPFPVAGLTHSYYAKFSKKFFIDKISQKNAPFDHQELPISIEIEPSPLSGSQSTSFIELLPPPIKQFPIAGEFASMIGFRLTNTSWSRQIVYYGGVRNKSPYSRATAMFIFSPQLLTVFLKWILPMIVVMTIVVLVPSIDAVLGDSRMAIAPAALLTLVILHDNYRSGFPPSPYLSFLDKIYAYNYLVCLAIFVVTLAGSNALCRPSNKDKDACVLRANRWDAMTQKSIIMGFLIVAFVSWYG
jgi:hypothetical protein